MGGHDGGWRLDHLFASAHLAVEACGYRHEWRDGGLSDHAALEADLALRSPSEAAGDVTDSRPAFES